MPTLPIKVYWKKQPNSKTLCLGQAQWSTKSASASQRRAGISMSLPGDIYLGSCCCCFSQYHTHHRTRGGPATVVFLVSWEMWRSHSLIVFKFNQWLSNAKYKKVQQVNAGTKPAAWQLNYEAIACHQATSSLLAFLHWCDTSWDSSPMGEERKEACCPKDYVFLFGKKEEWV